VRRHAALLDREPSLLVLEDGRASAGGRSAQRGETVGEAVFSTGMTGYQETLTDPSPTTGRSSS
jgi:carbamoyl-phosphate synthase small subunit